MTPLALWFGIFPFSAKIAAFFFLSDVVGRLDISKSLRNLDFRKNESVSNKSADPTADGSRNFLRAITQRDLHEFSFPFQF